MKQLIRSATLLVVLFAVALSPGRASDDAAKFPFVVPAAKAIDQIKDLEKVSGKKIGLQADEMKLLAEAATGKLETLSFADAALVASGVVEPARRAKYVEHLDRIVADARKALAGAASVEDKGDKLLKFLHAGPMSKPYDATQTDLSGILDTGRFNCVSSAVLYNVTARRLGLEVKAMEIAGGSFGTGHVFSILCDGDKKIPVETTNPKGFNVSTNMKKKGKREVGELGLIAIIYYNHGVSLGRKKAYQEALLANFCALGLDKSNPSAANNAMADLTNWGLDLANDGKHASALEVLRVGLALAPRDTKLLQNRNALIQQIVMKEIKAGKYADALSRIEEHKNLLPTKDQARQLALNVFDTQAQELRRKQEWQKVIAVYVEALKSHPGDRHLSNNLVASYDSWAQTHMQKSDWSGAIRVYEQGLERMPGNGHFANNLRYCQEQLKRR